MTHHPDASTSSHDLREAVVQILKRELIVRRDYDDNERAADWIDGFDEAAILILAGPIASELARLTGERDTWKRIAERAGVCMTCALGAPDISIGCTDCLNTGFAHGAPQGYVSEGFYEEEVGKLQRRLENRQDTINVLEEIIAKIEQPCQCAACVAVRAALPEWQARQAGKEPTNG